MPKHHVVTGLKELIVKCGHCGEAWTQPINPDERLSWTVCPHCNSAAPVIAALGLLDDYEMRG
jgi:translation initiation factor 2 beta subunit (eIF-2beta)/eIF-5